jgi:hypothetical protein
MGNEPHGFPRSGIRRRLPDLGLVMIAILALAAALNCAPGTPPANQYHWAFVLPARVECSPLGHADPLLRALESDAYASPFAALDEEMPNPFSGDDWADPFAPDEREPPEVLSAEAALGGVEATLKGLVRP